MKSLSKFLNWRFIKSPVTTGGIKKRQLGQLAEFKNRQLVQLADFQKTPVGATGGI